MVERPLREISLDRKNRKVVCEYGNKFIDFDLSKGKLRKQEVPETSDMLYIDKDRKELWFVEFKSSSEKNLDKEKFKLKRKLLCEEFKRLFENRFNINFVKGR